MADRYATQFIGAKDGTSAPPKKLDGSRVGAKRRRIQADKVPVADAINDRVFIGTLPAGANPCEFRVTTDTSLATTTLSIGTATVPAKYVDAKTVTATDVPQLLGPKVAALRQASLTADEDLWVTFGVAAVPGAAVVTFETEYTISA
jgi:hypothetical protein